MPRTIISIAVSLAVVALGCSSGVGLECGPGTVESDGQCLPTASPSTGGSGGSTGGSGGSSATGGSDTGGSGGSDTGGNSGSGGTGATGGSGGSTGGSGGSDCVPQDGGYLVTLTLTLAANQLPAILRHDLPGYGWNENALDIAESPEAVKVVATSGLHRFNAELADGGWLVRGDVELGLLSVPVEDLTVRVNCSDLQPIQRLAAGQVTIPPFSVWYGRERTSGAGQAFLCLGTEDCAIDAR